MKPTSPITRSPELKPFSHDHHHGLLLCWKIKTGMAKNIELPHIRKYVDWFYETHLKGHFLLEEKYIFPILEPDNQLVIQALKEHRALRKLFETAWDLEANLKSIEKELDLHIRFEERILFAEIQKAATKEQLKKIEEIHSKEAFIENEDADFWS
jgi:iron-sulfur cluster repair protein YtfE (RIC family)